MTPVFYDRSTATVAVSSPFDDYRLLHSDLCWLEGTKRVLYKFDNIEPTVTCLRIGVCDS